MYESSKSPKLIFEEKRAITLFLWLFYIFFFTYDLFWYIILPKFTDYGASKFPGSGLGYWLYVFILMLLPISMYYIKKGNPYIVKYILLFGYIIIDSVDSILIYYGTSYPFASGNIVELLFVFFSPVFVSKEFYWTVSLGLVGRYLLIGIILQDGNVMPPMMILIILSGIASILLIRFFSYINSLTLVHEELRQKEKLAVIGQMATAIAHEIRNPLSSLKGFTQLQLEASSDSNEYYPIMAKEIDRINLIVDDLMYLGKPREIVFEKVKINEIIDYTLSITKQQAVNQGVNFDTNIDTQVPPIECDENQLKQVFLNLIKNAIEAMPNGGSIIIKSEVLNKQSLIITIADEGCGIKEEDLQYLGDPFYTTKNDGTGLGLMITNQILKDHNGYLKIESKHGKGTRVIVTLPIYQRK